MSRSPIATRSRFPYETNNPGPLDPPSPGSGVLLSHTHVLSRAAPRDQHVLSRAASRDPPSPAPELDPEPGSGVWDTAAASPDQYESPYVVEHLKFTAGQVIIPYMGINSRYVIPYMALIRDILFLV